MVIRSFVVESGWRGFAGRSRRCAVGGPDREDADQVGLLIGQAVLAIDLDLGL
jgi:hypothetical protein